MCVFSELFRLRFVYCHHWATLAVNNDDGSNWEWLCDYLSVLTIRSDWFFLVLVTFWQTIRCSLQTDQQETHAVCRETAYVLKCTMASRGPPCNSTVLVFCPMLLCIVLDKNVVFRRETLKMGKTRKFGCHACAQHTSVFSHKWPLPWRKRELSVYQIWWKSVKNCAR